MRFLLNAFSSREDVMAAINMTGFQGGRTHTADALKKLVDEIFVPGKFTFSTYSSPYCDSSVGPYANFLGFNMTQNM